MISEEFQEECIAAVQTTVSQLNSKFKCLLNGIDCDFMDKNILNIIEEYSPFTPQIVSFKDIKQAFNDVNKSPEWCSESFAKFILDFISLNKEYGTKGKFDVGEKEEKYDWLTKYHEVINPTISELHYYLDKEYNLVLDECEDLDVELGIHDYGETYRSIKSRLIGTEKYACKLERYIELLRTLYMIGLYFVRKGISLIYEILYNKKEKLDVDSTLGIYCIHISYRVHQIMYKHGYISPSLYADIKSQMKSLKRRTLHFMKQNM